MPNGALVKVANCRLASKTLHDARRQYWQLLLRWCCQRQVGIIHIPVGGSIVSCIPVFIRRIVSGPLPFFFHCFNPAQRLPVQLNVTYSLSNNFLKLVKPMLICTVCVSVTTDTLPGGGGRKDFVRRSSDYCIKH